MLGIPIGDPYSPFPSQTDIERQEKALESPPRSLPGISLNDAEQLALLEALRGLPPDFPEQSTADWRFTYDNQFFSMGDADCLQAMIRHVRPARIVEVGSGYSSAAILDTNDRYFEGAVECILIDPDSARVRSLLRPGDFQRIRLIEAMVQDVELSVFEALQPNDILFIDSSHVTKAGSDVNHEIFEILPRLHAGTYIHFHDVFYPFGYPPNWITRGWAWSEAYLLRAFLQYNTAFGIVLFLSYLCRFHRDSVERAFPNALRCAPGSLWLRRVANSRSER
jgi:predicted O-methyltransferase YrrM